MRNTLVIMFLIVSVKGYSTIFPVGSTKTFVSPNDLYIANVVQDGDTIEIDGETYAGQSSLAVWGKKDLLIKGVDGRPHLIADGESILGKGIWVITGDNNIVENIEFSGATVPDKNGAGIRLDGNGLHVKQCYFHDNENGILTNNSNEGDILIEYSEFANNGFGDGYSHNLYIGHVNKLTFRFNYSHHTDIGHNLKSRAKENYILYNRIMDEDTGNSSRLIDLPNGGFSIIMGNLFMQGENATNNNIVGYGLEGLTNTAPHELYVINNTFVNKRMASCLFLSIKDGVSVANISNNIFAGTGTIINGTPTSINNNYIDESIENFGFINEVEFDYHLSTISPAIDYGTIVNSVNAHSLTPNSSYEHPTNYSLRDISNNVIDAGAYEYDQLVSNSNLKSEKILIFPNPTNGELNIVTSLGQIVNMSIYDTLGRIILSESNTIENDLSSLPAGLYYLKIKMKDGEIVIKQIIKK